MFGKVLEVPQTEGTPFYPRSPYGVAKAYGHWITVNYRESYDLFAVSGILFNHESPRRGLEFVERKVSDGVARDQRGVDTRAAARQSRRAARLGLRGRLRRGDVAHAAARRARRLRDRERRDAFGPRAVRDRVRAASGLDWQDHVVQDERFYRPAEVDLLIGDPAKAAAALGWTPRDELRRRSCEMMVDADLASLG